MIEWGHAGVGFSNIFHLGCFILLWVLSEKRKLRQFIRCDDKEKRFFSSEFTASSVQIYRVFPPGKVHKEALIICKYSTLSDSSF